MPVSETSEPVSSLPAASKAWVFRRFLQRLGGQRWVSASITWSRYERPSSVKTWFGWSVNTGSRPGSGNLPSSSDGTACSVCGCTVVALRNHVASRASAPRFGKRTASTWPRRSISEPEDSSSKTITTTDVRDFTETDFACACSGKTSFEAGDKEEVEAPGGNGADQLRRELEHDEDDRREERERKREENDLTPRRPAHSEKRRVLAEDVEKGLCEREGAERRQMGAAAA